MRHRPFQLATLFTAALGVVASWACPADAQLLTEKEVPAQARGLDVKEHLGAPLPADLQFTNDAGKTVRLGDYFTHTLPSGAVLEGKPTVVAMVYYTCPVVCSAMIQCISREVEKLDISVGKDFNVLFFSFSDLDTVDGSAVKKKPVVQSYLYGDKRDAAAANEGWQFHTGSPESVRTLANALGFTYRKIEGTADYAHPIAFFVITPDGKIARYIYGFGFDAKQIKLALIEASEGKISQSLSDRIVSFCYMYDPKVGQYTIRAVRVMQLGGLTTMTLLFGTIGVMLVGERAKRRRKALALSHSQAPSQVQSSPPLHAPAGPGPTAIA